MQRRPVFFSKKAEGDLNWIYGTVASPAGPDIALRYVERIKRFCDGLDYASERGTLRNDIRPGLRIFGFENRVTIAFVAELERVVILRVFYGGANWQDEF